MVLAKEIKLRRGRIVRALALAALVLSGAACHTGQERILEYTSDVTIDERHNVFVTETVKVLVRGDRIRKGIHWTSPQHYQKPGSGEWVPSHFSLISVEEGGVPFAFHTWSDEELNHVFIGDSAQTLASGTYTFAITYGIASPITQLGAGHDITWHVTGQGWSVPMDRVESVVRLPSGAEILAHDAYIIGRERRDCHCTAELESPNRLSYSLHEPLKAKTGLVVNVSWELPH